MFSILKRTLKKVIREDIFYDLRKYYVRNKLMKGAYDYNEKEMFILKHLVKSGDIALDIGANIGSYTLVLSKLVDRNGSVHAFEPIPLTYGYLIFNMRQDIYKNVVTYNVAIGHKSGLCRMVLPDIGTEDIYQARLKQQEIVVGKDFIIPMFTLDSLYQHCFSKVDFIKCDVEGAELLVFKGARQVLFENKPKIICEISSKCKEFCATERDFFRMLVDYGYKAYFYDGKNLVSCTNVDKRNQNANYIFFHTDDPDIHSIIRELSSK